MESPSTALYRRQRPETFAQVIGQEHVTEPLATALDSGRINHAYLFSGPRGCGKTTSARIFARCLNCVQGPTSTPCGQCDSCRDLARGGPGSLDVVELDAASHGGVDDARDLRERAIFSPARDRYKVFIIDEAHMVTTQGFNALLKLVEEPPQHVKFVFATTEPDKVIPTIRSRTHHYPFRLVPPDKLGAYIEELAQSDGTELEDGVIALVVRAGGGSVRDSLSVLDQLMAGAEGGQVTYERAVALLGYTPEGLLDDAVDALAAHDSAGLFNVVEQVIGSGHDPRRFTEDLLERFRDLIVVLAASSAPQAVLPHIPADQLQRMQTQANHLGAAGCSRAADVVHEALQDMVGATSPRLQLELLCARLLLPTAEEGVRALAVRLDRLETSGPPPAASTQPAPAPSTQPQPSPAGSTQPAPASPQPSPRPAQSTSPSPSQQAASAWKAASQATQRAEQPKEADQDWPEVAVPAQPQQPASSQQPAQAQEGAPSHHVQQPAQPKESGPPQQSTAGLGGGGETMSVQQLRNRWPEVLQALARIRRASWALVAQDAQVVDLQAQVLTIGFSTTGLASAFRSGTHADALTAALADTLGLQVRVESTIVGAGGQNRNPTPPPQAQHSGSGPQPRQTPPPRPAPSPQSTPPPQPSASANPPPQPESPQVGNQPHHPSPAEDTQEATMVGEEADEYSPDDENISGSELVGPPLVKKMLGGTIIDEIVDEEG